MAKKISQMPTCETIKEGDISIVVQDGETKKFNLDLLPSKVQIDEYKIDVENQLSTYEQEITDIKNQYDKELYTPEINVTGTLMVKTGQGDDVDYSANVEDGLAKSAILKGATKYHDVDTDEILDTFEEGRNLELISVKMPVLTTTGKNLFDIENTGFLIETYINAQTMYRIPNGKMKEFILNPNKLPNIKVSLNYYKEGSDDDSSFGRYVYTNGTEEYMHPKALTSDTSKSIYSIHFYNWVSSRKIYINNLMVSEDVAIYEPYKSNILSTPEYLELGSVGDTKDELNMITRELIQRTSIRDYIDGDESDSTVITDMTNTRYILSAPTTSTIDLTPSGTLASEKPYMWKDGSIQLSSDGLIPDLDYSVITSRVGVIESNMQETIQNEKRIHNLEVMLANATISSAYDTVSLLSDVEVTTISLDAETTQNEPDEFLYDMILLLIERNAYDESLFDKVSVFYLYSKLSDEQFMNIYNLLYPEEE